MLDVHINDFYKDCATILLQGFSNFPISQILYVEDICGPDEMDEFGLHSRRHQAALGAIIWLKDEGFIRFGAMNRQESVDDFVITATAFSRLMKRTAVHSYNDTSANSLTASSFTPPASSSATSGAKTDKIKPQQACFELLQQYRIDCDSVKLAQLLEESILQISAQ